MQRVVIYDLDGTLVDTACVVAEILNRMREQKNWLPISVQKVRLLTALGGEDMIRIALGCPENKISERLEEFREIYKATSTSETVVFPGVKKVLSRLKSLGIRVAICTNKPQGLAIKTLQETNLFKFFDYAVYFDENGLNKPNPEPLIKIIDYFGLPKSEFVFIGDTQTDFLAALRADIKFIFFDSGYDLKMRSRTGLKTLKNHHQIFFEK